MRKIDFTGRQMTNNLMARLKRFGWPDMAIPTLAEAVNALDKYENLPQATKDSMQAICDVYNVNLEFSQKHRKMALTGIFTALKCSYLYPDGEDGLKRSQRFIKNSKTYHLHPGANHILIPAE